ncbi:MAG: NnrU family protein [Rhodospirillales bacterium]|nr:NnrU family protein [Rhodospirillales bacterium]
MGLLVLAALIWIATHSGLAAAGPRGWLVQRAGEGGYRGLYSAISLASLVFLIIAFRRAPAVPLWSASLALRGLLALVMLVAFLLLGAGVTIRSPTAIGGESAAPDPRWGILRVTRHPLLWSLTLWAGAHMIGLGTADGLVFFGAFLVTSLWGMPSIDAKLAARNPALAAELVRSTSIVPFGAILAGRNRFVAEEIGWAWPLAAVFVWAIFLAFVHHWLFGVSPL